MTNGIDKEGQDVPTDPRALRRLERQIESGWIEEIPGAALGHPRYLVTYMLSNSRGRIRSATVVSVTNQSPSTNHVSVSWFAGLGDNLTPSHVTSLAIPPDFTVEFGTRKLPPVLTKVNSVCNPELDLIEGRAIVSSTLPEIGLSARVYYTAGDDDLELLAITDSKVVVLGQGNSGD